MTQESESPSPPGGQNVTGDDNIVTRDITNSVVNISKSVTNVFAGAEKKPPREPDAPPPPGVLPEPKAAFPDWYLPIPRNAVFTGREADLLALAEALLYHPQAGVTAISAVKGEGGIGKSQLAVEFAYRYGRYFYGVHWIPAGENQDIGAGIAVCGEKIGLPGWPEKLPEQVDATLRAWGETPLRLVVLDNLEDPEKLREWLPRWGMCRILITTRRGSWPEELGVRDHVLDTLSLPEARDLLRKLAKRLKKTPDSELDALANQLGCLPLALDLAGRYLDECKNISVGAYLEEIQSGGAIKHESLVDWTKKTPTLHAPSIAATFALSWNQLDEASRYDALAKHIFFAAGYCAPNTPIPLELLQTAVGEKKDSTFSHALRRLADLGLMRESENGPILHPLLTEFARLVEPQDSGALAGVVKTLLKASYAVEGNHSTKDWQPFRAHLEMAAAYKEGIGLEQAFRLLYEVGLCLHTYGEYSRARERYEQSLAIAQELGDRSGVANSLHQLGMLHQDQGEYPQAREFTEQSLAIFQELGDRSGVASSLHQLGMLHQQQGEYRQARQYYQQSLSIFQKMGNQSSEARSLLQLGTLHQQQGEYTQARQYCEQSLAIVQELGDRLGIAYNLHQLGTLHQRYHEYPQARQYYEQSLDIFQELGDRSNQAKSLHQLGTLHQEQREYTQARQLAEQSLTIFQELGDRSGVAHTLGQLGMLLYIQGEYSQAHKYNEQSLGIFQKMGNWSGVAKSLGQLGTLHQRQGKYPQARQYYEQSLGIFQELGEQAGVAIILAEMGALAMQDGQPALAAAQLMQALAIFEQLGMPQRQQVRLFLKLLKETMGDAAFAEAVAAVRGEGTVPDLVEDEQSTSMEELVKVVVNTTVAVMMGMPEKKGEWWNAVGQIISGVPSREQNDLAVFLDLVRQLLEGASPERLTARVPHVFLAAWEAILKGISKG